MNKIGNQHSSLLDNMTKIAETEKKPESGFTINIEQSKQKTLKELFAQFTEDIDPAMNDMPDAPTGELPLEEGMGGDTEEAKRGLCEALVALCGSIDEAHSCLDQHCGESIEGGEMPPEEPMAEPMEAAPMEAPMPMPMPGL